MNAYFVGPINLSIVEEELDKQDISFESWSNDCNGDIEVRVSLFELTQEQLDYLKNKFGSEIENYDYLIFWK